MMLNFSVSAILRENWGWAAGVYKTSEYFQKSTFFGSYLLYGIIIAVRSAAVPVEGRLLERLVLEVPLEVVLQDLRVVGDESGHGVPHHEQQEHLHGAFDIQLG